MPVVGMPPADAKSHAASMLAKSPAMFMNWSAGMSTEPWAYLAGMLAEKEAVFLREAIASPQNPQKEINRKERIGRIEQTPARLRRAPPLERGLDGVAQL
jgi:hypothetical protein